MPILFRDKAKSGRVRRITTITNLTNRKKGSTPSGIRIGVRKRR